MTDFDRALLAEATATAQAGLATARRLMAVAQRSGVALDSRLTPDMFDLGSQIEIGIGFTLRIVFPLLNQPVPQADHAADIAGLSARADWATVQIAALDPGLPVARNVRHRAGFADLEQSPEDYLRRFAIPNLWFHLGMGFAILRQNGADLGKADWDGLHFYPPDFRWPR